MKRLTFKDGKHYYLKSGIDMRDALDMLGKYEDEEEEIEDLIHESKRKLL